MFGGPPVFVKGPPPGYKPPLGGRDVRGPIPYQAGWIARPPGSDYRWRNMLAVQRQRSEAEKNKQSSHFGVDIALVREEFLDKSEEKILAQQIQRKVALGLKAADWELDVKREKLRDMLWEEECALYKEFIDKAQHADDRKMEEYRQQALAIKSKQEADRKAIAEEKRIEQYKLRFDEYRTLKSQMILEETKQIQLSQIQEKMQLKERAKEEEKFWRALMEKQNQAWLSREEKEELERERKRKETVETLSQQLMEREKDKEKEMQEHHEQMMLHERAMELLKIEQDKAGKETQEKREKVASELKEQIQQRKEFLRQQKLENLRTETVFLNLSRAELQREKAAVVDNKGRLKRERDMYKESLEKLRREQEEQMREIDKLIAEEQANIQQKRDNEYIKARSSKKALLQDVLKGREEQLAEKKLQEMEEKEKFKAEQHLTEMLMEKQKRLDCIANMRMKQAHEKYKRDLSNQIEEQKRMQREEDEQNELRWQETLQEEEKFLRKVQDLLAAKEISSKTHPFTKLLQGSLLVCDPLDEGVQDCLCPALLPGKAEQKQVTENYVENTSIRELKCKPTHNIEEQNNVSDKTCYKQKLSGEKHVRFDIADSSLEKELAVIPPQKQDSPTSLKYACNQTSKMAKHQLSHTSIF